MGFGVELKKILKNKGISVAELSRLSDIPVNTLYAIISRDSSKLSVNTVYKIYAALNLSSDEQAILDICVNPDKWGLPYPNKTNSVNNKESTDNKSIEALHTIAAHFDGDEYTEEELEEIKKFAEFVKERRKQQP